MYLDGRYNYYIVALSVLIAVLASYSILNITAKISEANGRMKYFWLLAGSIVMGCGIWSMHFIGMLAFHLPVSIKYDVGLTLISMLASTISSFIALYVTMPKDINTSKIALGGFFIASGILAMHYIGMEAMIMPVTISYDTTLVVVSIMIAYIASYAALFLFLRFKDQASQSWLKLVSAILMGSAICGMHYTGMEAASFYTNIQLIEDEHSFDPFLLYGVTITIFILLLISSGAMFFERHAFEKMAYEDPLTNLPNRNEMNRTFGKVIQNEPIGVLFIDLDQFKSVNDTLGHHVGDLILKEFAKRLRPLIDSHQKAFRIGGDEFLFIVRRCTQKHAIKLAEQIKQINKKAYTGKNHELYITTSIGICVGSTNVLNTSTLLKNADTAMYRAKKNGKNQYFVYDCETNKEELRRTQLEEDLWNALDHHQLSIVYQPKWDTKENDLYGFEALLYWKHPHFGMIFPDEFMPIAEENGLIVPITRWAVDHASRQCKKWQEQGMPLPVSLNLSSQLFQLDNLPKWIQSVLKKVKLDPYLIELEIAESAIIHNVDHVALQLQRIRDLGVKVSLDGFGTKYSSIGLLGRLPLNTLKLDQTFVNNLDVSKQLVILKTIIEMAESIGMEVIAEGVETEEQVTILSKVGCHLMQGYYFSKPMEVREIERWLKSRQIVLS